MNVLICGSRDWSDEYPIFEVLSEHYDPKRDLVIHGAARGADMIADAVARRLGYTVMSFPADWRGHGRAAGPIRNKLMLDTGRPDVVWAFKRDFDETLQRGGTENMVRIARGAGVETWVVTE